MRVTNRKRTGCRRVGAFTLIELLVVMGIVGLLLVMAIGGYQSIGRAAQVDTAITQLKFTLQLTRQWAIANRQTTWIVFPTMRPPAENFVRHTIHNADGTPVGSPLQVATDVNFRSYGVYAEVGNTHTEMIREWSYLPPSVFFDWRPWNNSKNVLNPAGAYKIPNTAQWDADLRSNLPAPALGFLPNGSLHSKSSDPELFISEGFIAPEPPPPPPTHERLTFNYGPASGFTYNPASHDFVLHSIQVYRFTGLPQINRYGEDDL